MKDFTIFVNISTVGILSTDEYKSSKICMI
jgi:hypothetical protein